MKLSLLVLTPGKSEGKVIPIPIPQFVIGRDPDCQLRPASALISKRHCAVLVRGGKAFVRDFESTNGTFVNDQPVKGEQELRNDDQLKVGPLAFRVRIEARPAAGKPEPAQPAPAAESGDDESVAAMLLSIQDDEGSTPATTPLDSEGIPTGSTVMEAMTPTGEDGKEEGKPGANKPAAAKPATGNTSSAAKAILDKYIRRPRG
jgi:pSer/pThr/pTyr-binding forkhead associated (FHA) protein